MTTKDSPLSAIKVQADKIAVILKAAERGEKFDMRFAQKIADARARGTFKFAIVMDDKVVSVEMPWSIIRDTDEAGISEYIVNQMRETNDAIH